MRRRAKILGWAVGVWLAGGASGQLAVPELVANLNQTPSDVAFTAYDYAELDETTLLLATDFLDHGLWATDGTAAGTRQLADLCPWFGSCGIAPTFLGSDGERALFIAQDGSGVPQLWVSDGTLPGTLVLTTFTFWPQQGLVPEVWDAERGRLYFRATTLDRGFEPWVSDGTVAGTRMLADLAPGPESSSPFAFVPSPAGVFVSTRLSSTSEELWVSNGQPGGSLLLAESGINGLWPLGVASGRLIFLRQTDQHGIEPWVSDGTLAGTRLLKDTVPGPDGYVEGGRPYVAALSSLLFFSGSGSGPTSSLWRTDGTPGGTFALPAPTDSSTFYPGSWLAGSNRLWWLQSEGGSGGRLWTSDGTVAGTRSLLDTCYQGCFVEPAPVLLAGNRALLVLDDPLFGRELWRSDGTVAGTVRVKDICRGPCSSRPLGLVPSNGGAVFSAIDDQGVTQLWRTDGTAEGTLPIVSLPVHSQGQVTIDRGATAPNGDFLFSFAADADSGLFATTGASGFRLLSPLGRRLDRGSSPGYLAVVGGRLLFQAALAEGQAGLFALVPGGSLQELRPVAFPDDHLYGITATKIGERVFLANNFDRLYVTDGTPAGTRRIELPAASRCGLVPFGAGQVLMFLDAGSDRDLELWASDGTPAGTRLVSRDAGPRRCDLVRPSAELGGLGYFIGSGGDLWRTDGTAAGTVRLFDFDSPGGYHYGELVAGAGRLWIVASRGEQSGLWLSDGTTAGTRFVSPLVQGSEAYYELTPIGDRVVFSAFTSEDGYELWASDGTAAGTGVVSDLRPGAESSESFGLVASGGKVYFTANDGLHGRELWITDGTAEGTRMVIDLRPGATSGRTLIKVPFRGGLLFSASDGEHGAELWVTDGTRLGTRLVADLAPGAASSLPGWTAIDGATLYFTADDGQVGEELWKVTIPPEPPPCTSPEDLCLHNDRIRVRVGWRDPRSGNSGVGTAIPFSTQSGFFWFFNPANVELVVKVLDGGPVNEHWWTFYGALSDVEYWVEVTDLETGQTETYRNPPRNICGLGDTTSLPKSGIQEGAALRFATFSDESSAARTTVGSCAAAAGTLCLLDGRFAVSVDWRNFRTGETGVGTALPGSDQSGSFWFFNPGNIELVVKMLDGRAANGHFWFFYGALSDVEYTVRVTDTVSGLVNTYENPARNICGRGDTTAFPQP